MTSYRARWVFTGGAHTGRQCTELFHSRDSAGSLALSPDGTAGTLLTDGAVTIERNRIVSVETNQEHADVDLGDVALIPGLVNAHSHLEFSDCRQPLEPLDDFPDWIRTVIDWRRNRGVPGTTAIQSGLQESLSSGVTTLAEIATTDWRDTLSLEQPRPDVLMFREVLGLGDDAADHQGRRASEFLSQASRANISVGLSPHAPYSVHPELFTTVCKLAESQDVPLAMHLAESRAEIELLEQGSGPLVDLLLDLGVWKPGVIRTGTRPMDYLNRLASLPRVLIVHGNYLSSAEMAFIARHPQMSVVYCPRTHDAMQPDPHPWQAMLDQGINVALGTDSRASNPDLSLFRELQFLKQHHPDVPAARLFRLGTSNSARALGFNDRGVLAPGYRADLCVVQLPSGEVSDAAEELLSPKSYITAIMQAGQWMKAPQPGQSSPG